MASVSNVTTTSKNRQSCDRCHGQKLRCIHAGNSDTDTCNRCLRQGAQCVYSSSLRKGRPSMYRLADTFIPPSNPSASTSVRPELHRRNAASSDIAIAATSASAGAGASASASANASANTHGHAHSNANTDDDANVAGPSDTSSPWPWLEQLDWNTIQVDGMEQDMKQWASNLHTDVDPQIDAGAAFLDPFPSLQGWAPGGSSGGNDSARGAALSPTRLPENGQGLRGDISEKRRRSSSSSNSSNSSSSSGIAINKKGPNVGIAWLSQLSTRLYPLLTETAKLSDQPRDRNQAPHSPLIDDAAFKSVAAWLVQVSANLTLPSRTDRRNPALETTRTGGILHDAFSASHQLLEILRCLQIDDRNSASSSTSSVSTSAGGTHLDYWASVTSQTTQSSSSSEKDSQYFEQRTGSWSYASSPSQYSNTVVRHLVIACHTLLLNIYVAVLIALQRYADRWSSCRSRNQGADTHAAAAALADIRPVLAVQLCSYLIERQHGAVDLYLSPQSPTPSSQQHELSALQKRSAIASTDANREVVSDLKKEVQQRLERLRQTLRI